MIDDWWLMTKINMLTGHKCWSVQGSWEVTNQGVAGLAGTKIFRMAKILFFFFFKIRWTEKYEEMIVRPRSDSNRASRLATDPLCAGFIFCFSTFLWRCKCVFKWQPNPLCAGFIFFFQLFSTLWKYFQMATDTLCAGFIFYFSTFLWRCKCVFKWQPTNFAKVFKFMSKWSKL